MISAYRKTSSETVVVQMSGGSLFHSRGTNTDIPENEKGAGYWLIKHPSVSLVSSPGGQDVAADFRSQEIDGQALLLLTEDHLVSTMNLKLGPALKLCAHINSLKDAWTINLRLIRTCAEKEKHKKTFCSFLRSLPQFHTWGLQRRAHTLPHLSASCCSVCSSFAPVIHLFQNGLRSF